MPEIILSDIIASVSELKKNPMAAVSSGEGYPVAILNRNKPSFIKSLCSKNIQIQSIHQFNT